MNCFYQPGAPGSELLICVAPLTIQCILQDVAADNVAVNLPTTISHWYIVDSSGWKT